MVNKRFNRKFRRALGAALGALAVSSISNIETIGAAFTEATLTDDPDIGWLPKISETCKDRLYTEAANLYANTERYNPNSGISAIIVDADLGNIRLSFPQCLSGYGQWAGGYNVTLEAPGHRTCRICIMKTRDLMGEAATFMIAPSMKPHKAQDYMTHQEIPMKGDCLGRNSVRGPHSHPLVFAGHPNAGCVPPHTFFHSSHNYTTAPVGGPPPPPVPPPPVGVPPAPPPPPAPLLGPRPELPNPIKNKLFRWEDIGCLDVTIWNEILGDAANKHKMYYDIKTCPPELRSFYYPEEKKEDTTFISNSSPAPVINPTPTNMAPAMAALGVIPATMALANQPAPTPAHVVANNNVTQGSNNAGAAPSAQNGSVSSGSADVGPTSQTGSDVKPTSVQHDAKSKSDSNEPLKT